MCVWGGDTGHERYERADRPGRGSLWSVEGVRERWSGGGGLGGKGVGGGEDSKTEGIPESRREQRPPGARLEGAAGEGLWTRRAAAPMASPHSTPRPRTRASCAKVEEELQVLLQAPWATEFSATIWTVWGLDATWGRESGNWFPKDG